MKRVITLILLSGLMAYSCSDKLKRSDTRLKELEQPFEGKKYFSDKKYFRAIGEGKANDLTVAKRIAETNARQGLASQIEVKVRSVGEQFLQNRSIDQKLETTSKYEDITRTVIDETLRNVEVFDQRSYQNKKGNYVHYVAMQMSTKSISDKMSEKISTDEQLKQDFELEKFRKIYEEELEKYQSGN